MSRAARERVNAIFHGALARPDSERSAYLADVCGADADLRREVESLLSSYREAGDTSRVAVAMIGRSISHYVTEKCLGTGGMGEVYLARDLALGRQVALKLLVSSVDPQLKTRLLREAEASARLQHPCIATFYEAGEADGMPFMAMEFVPGSTLRDRLKNGPLPADQALAVGACLLEALAHAHAVGLLHRDIKPANVMVTGERSAKLLDFGIAKDLGVGSEPAASTVTALTGVDKIVGTVGYMAPEQLSGGRVDARADLFAVGAVLYEALSGRPAFPGANATERIAATLSRDPAPVSGPGLAPEIWSVLSRALARDPNRRYPTAKAFLSDLEKLTSGELVAALPSTLAVLDFHNIQQDPSADWIGSAIAESVSADLGAMPGLQVVLRERVLRARASAGAAGGPVDPLEVALQLGSRWVLSGTYHKAGPALRVTARLAEVSTGRLLFSEKVDRSLEGIFEIEDRISAACAEALRLQPADATEEVRSAPNLSAYEAYARGRRLWLRLEKGSLDAARELYERAVSFDPSHALALSGLAAVHCMRFIFTTDPAELEVAGSYGRRAAASDPALGEAHVWLGFVHMRSGRPSQALEEARTVMRLSPDNFQGLYLAACSLLMAGSLGEALPFFQQAIAIEAQAGLSWLGLGWTHMRLDKLVEARSCLEKAVSLEGPQAVFGTAGCAGHLAECLRRAGDLPAARAQCLAGLASAERSDHIYRDTFRATCLCALGRIALQQGDAGAAHAAFGQAAAHLRGRPRALGGGHLVVQALAGLGRAGEGEAGFVEARQLFDARGGFDFSWFYGCSDDVTLLELSRAAGALGRPEEARSLWERARAAGATESFDVA
jgi:serine/threonine-protein kinase